MKKKKNKKKFVKPHEQKKKGGSNHAIKTSNYHEGEGKKNDRVKDDGKT